MKNEKKCRQDRTRNFIFKIVRDNLFDSSGSCSQTGECSTVYTVKNIKVNFDTQLKRGPLRKPF